MEALSAGQAAQVNNSSPALQNVQVGDRLKDAVERIAVLEGGSGGDTRLDDLEQGVAGLEQGVAGLGARLQTYFGTATLTAAAAGTPVPVVPESAVPAGKKIHVLDVVLNVTDSTPWTDSEATKVQLQDTADTPVVAVAFAKDGLTSGAVLLKTGANVTPGPDVLLGSGLTADKGLDVAGDANFTAGSDIKVSVLVAFI